MTRKNEYQQVVAHREVSIWDKHRAQIKESAAVFLQVATLLLTAVAMLSSVSPGCGRIADPIVQWTIIVFFCAAMLAVAFQELTWPVVAWLWNRIKPKVAQPGIAILVGSMCIASFLWAGIEISSRTYAAIHANDPVPPPEDGDAPPPRPAFHPIKENSVFGLPRK